MSHEDPGAELAVEVLSAAHAPALSAFLAQHSAGCCCQFWRFDGDDYAWQLRLGSEPERNQLALDQDLASGSVQGMVARLEQPDQLRQLVGWLQLCDAAALSKLGSRRVYRTLASVREPAAGTLRIGCMLIAPSWRGRGLAHRLLAAAVEHARLGGARFIEAFPRVSEAPLRQDELWMGPAQCYRALGFEHVAGPDGYPVLRLAL